MLVTFHIAITKVPDKTTYKIAHFSSGFKREQNQSWWRNGGGWAHYIRKQRDDWWYSAHFFQSAIHTPLDGITHIQGGSSLLKLHF